MFSLLRAWRRRRWARRPFPSTWRLFLERLGFSQRLPSELQARFRDLVKLFVWEKHFVGAGGLDLTDEIKVVVAAAAVRLVLHLDLSYYDDLAEIVIYPHEALRHPTRDDQGPILGEAHHFGTVILSWPAVVAGLAYECDGHDTALHEFAHVLDKRGGSFDGTPRLRAREHYQAWAEVMSHHFLRLRRGRHPERRVMRAYGAQNEAEFFAVATESFFERPRHMKEETPELYAELARFYGTDPASGSPC